MKFLERPNLPNKRAGSVIVDYRTAKTSLKALERLGINVILSCGIPSLNKAVRGHTDMMIHHLGGGRFVCAIEAYEYFKRELSGAEIIKGSKALNAKYPADIAYNAAAVGDFLICNAAYTDKEILGAYGGGKILNVKQGYAKCGVCVVSDNAIITSDGGIYKTALENGIDALKITEGDIRLDGMNYGFIGGASGLIANDTLAINGNIKKHRDSGAIIEFCEKHGVETLSLNDGDIEDIGSIIPISEG